MPAPVLQIPCLKHAVDQPQKPAIVDLLRPDPDHEIMIKRNKAVGDVDLDEPVGPLPDLHDLAQRGVAASAGTETMGVTGKLGLVVGLQQQAHHFSDQLVRPARQAQRALLPVLFWNMDALDWPPPIPLTPQPSDDRLG